MKKWLILFFVILVGLMFIVSGCEEIKGKVINKVENKNIQKNILNEPSHLVSNIIIPKDNNQKIQEQQKYFIDKEIELPKYYGYIIEFKDKPLIEKKLELENAQAELRRDNDEINVQLNNYYSELVSQHNQIKDDIKNKIVNFDNKLKAEYTKTFNGITLDINEQELEEIRSLPDIKNIYPNYEVKVLLQRESLPIKENLLPVTPREEEKWDWHLDKINVKNIWRQGYKGDGIKVAIIDTGIDSHHEDIEGKVIEEHCYSSFFFDCPNERSEQHGEGAGVDVFGHGTHVAGLVAGRSFGVAPDVKLISIRVLSSMGGGVISDVIKAIDLSVDPNNDNNFEDHYNIISMSLGHSGGAYGGPDTVAVNNAINAGVVVVVAAGNSGPFPITVDCPGCVKRAITVGASDINDKLAWFSSRGPVLNDYHTGGLKPDVIAPGVNICSSRFRYFSPWRNDEEKRSWLCNNDEDHIFLSGTSMATPIVSGVVALIKQAHPDWSPEEIKSALMLSIVKIKDYNEGEQDVGRINAYYSVHPYFLLSLSALDFEDVNSQKMINFVLKNLYRENIEFKLFVMNKNRDVKIEFNNNSFNISSGERVNINSILNVINYSEPYYELEYGFIIVNMSIMNRTLSYKFPFSFYKSTNKKSGVFEMNKGEILIENGFLSHLRTLASIDYDSDGDNDLIAGELKCDKLGENCKDILYLYKNEDNIFEREIIYEPLDFKSTVTGYDRFYPNYLSGIIVDDFNGDNKPDIAIGSGQGFVRVLYNRLGNQNTTILNITLSERDNDRNGFNFIISDNNITMKRINPPYTMQYIANSLSYPNDLAYGNEYEFKMLDKNEPLYLQDVKIKLDDAYIIMDQQENFIGRTAILEISDLPFKQYILGKTEQDAFSLVSLDYDNDGYMDIISSYYHPQTDSMVINLFLNNRDQTFSEPMQLFSEEKGKIYSLSLGDFDNDGNKDLLIGYNYKFSGEDGHSDDYLYDLSIIKMLKNNNGQFILNDTEVMRRGERTYGYYPYNHRINPYIVSADFDNDGDTDFIEGDNSGILEYFENKGNANFVSKGKIFDFGQLSWGLASTDFNRDGKIDIMISSITNSLYGRIYYKENKLQIIDKQKFSRRLKR